jgi:DNA-binding transcriptional LysR family regulator
MNLRALMYFDELVRSNSMREVAEKFDVAPTAVSRQIENLEEHFGAQLLERSARGVTLTPAGEILALQAGKTLRELDHVQQLIGDLSGLKTGRIRIYANGAAVAHLLAPVLVRFSLQHPELRYEVTITSAAEAMEALSSAKADVAISLFAPRQPDFKVRSRIEVTYDAIIPIGHPLATKGQVSFSDLTALPLALPDKSFAARQAIDDAAASAGFELDPVFVTGSLEMLKELVLSGAAITLLPQLSVLREIEEANMVAMPFVENERVCTEIDLCISPDRPLSIAAHALVNFIENFMVNRS